MKIPGSVAFITGAASGLGAAVAALLESEGAGVTCFDPGIDPATHTDNVLPIPGSVADEQAVSDAMAKTLSHFGKPAQILINCAGIGLPGQRIAGHKGPFPLSSFRSIVDVNLVGTFNVMSLGAQCMLEIDLPENEERGVIINVSSINAEDGPVGTLPYSTTKAAVCGMTLPAARDLGPFGIRVNCIMPGSMDTPMLNSMPAEMLDIVISKNAFPKRPGHPEEFASLARHIIDNSAINGVNYRLDCGARLAFGQ